MEIFYGNLFFHCSTAPSQKNKPRYTQELTEKNNQKQGRFNQENQENPLKIQ